jgi:hypothetical protein
MIVAALAFVDPAAPAPGYHARPIFTRTAHELLEAPDRRVRTACARVQRLLAEGLRHSPTFRSVMAALDRTDVIVYVEFHRGLRAAIAGRLMMVPSTGFQRYARIQLAPGGSLQEQIGTLAHELQHAVEVGEAPEVRDPMTLQQLYTRIGITSLGRHSYDTLAAQQTGRRVRLELSS